MLCTQSVIMKANIPEAKPIYGLIYDTPESVIILAGHRSQIMILVTELTNSNKRQKLYERHQIFTSTRKMCRRRSETPETPIRSRIHSKLPCSSDSTFFSLVSIITRELTKDNEEMQELMTLSNTA